MNRLGKDLEPLSFEHWLYSGFPDGQNKAKNLSYCRLSVFSFSLVSFHLDHRFEIQVLRDDGNYFSDFDTIVICFANFCLDISLFVFGHFVNGHLPKGRSFPKWQNGRQSQLCFFTILKICFSSLQLWKKVG